MHVYSYIMYVCAYVRMVVGRPTYANKKVKKMKPLKTHFLQKKLRRKKRYFYIC